MDPGARGNRRLFADIPGVEHAKQSPQALVGFVLSRMTPAASGSMLGDLTSYASSAAWTGSDTQMQTKASGLAHLILGSAEYQFV